MTANRLEKLRARLAEASLDAILVSQPENRRYLSGFTGSAGWLLISRDGAILTTDFRYTEQASHQAPAFRVVQTAGEMAKWMPPLLQDLGPVKKVGFEAEHIPFAGYRRIAKVLGDAGLELIPSEGLVEPLRAIKDADEREALLRAIQVTDQAFESVRSTLRPGLTERQVAWMIEQRMREAGAESVSFDLIVATGPNGAMAHHRPDDTALQVGQPIVIDIGAKVDGYCSDLTRTVVIGKPDDTFKRIHDIVLTAQETAIATIQAGITGEQGDAIAREIIERAGHGDQFGHSLGHGVGLAVHEFPRLGRTALEQLQDCMIFTVEPGIYISGWGGIRIEDVVELRNGRCVTLSAASKQELVRI